MNTTEIIILAGGKGTRMDSDLPKCLVPVRGVSMIDRLLSNIIYDKLQKPLMVIGYKGELIEKHVGERARFVIQKEQKGTAHAAQVALSALLPTTEKVIILYADHPFVTPKTIGKMLKGLENKSVVLGTVDAGDFSDWKSLFKHWGRIMKNKEGDVDSIVEYKDASNDIRKISRVNPGYYAFDVKILEQALAKVQPNNMQGEYYLTDVIRIAREEGNDICEVDIDPPEALGINSKAELEYAESLLG